MSEKQRVKVMNRNILGGLAARALIVWLICLLSPAAGAAQTDKKDFTEFSSSHPNLPPTTSFLISQLKKYGFEYSGTKEEMVGFKADHAVVILKLDDKNVVKAGLVQYKPNVNIKGYSVAVYLVYATLELNRSNHADSKEIAARVSKLTPKLIEKVGSSLQTSPASAFLFDDMDVQVRQSAKKKGFVGIFLQPH